MALRQTTTIEVDTAAAEIIRRAEARARSQGESLGSYLQHALPAEVVNGKKPGSQAEAWNSYVSAMTLRVQEIVPTGYVADDSRDSMYDDRN